MKKSDIFFHPGWFEWNLNWGLRSLHWAVQTEGLKLEWGVRWSDWRLRFRKSRVCGIVPFLEKSFLPFGKLKYNAGSSTRIEAIPWALHAMVDPFWWNHFCHRLGWHGFLVGNPPKGLHRTLSLGLATLCWLAFTQKYISFFLLVWVLVSAYRARFCWTKWVDFLPSPVVLFIAWWCWWGRVVAGRCCLGFARVAFEALKILSALLIDNIKAFTLVIICVLAVWTCTTSWMCAHAFALSGALQPRQRLLTENPAPCEKYLINNR